MGEEGGFNHNCQSLRIVEMLEERYTGFRGLNLTWEVREGIVKHTTDYDSTDARDYEPDKRATLEGQLVNAADEIAYTSHDLDDGLRSGLIRNSDLQGIRIWQHTLRALHLRGGELPELARRRAIRHLINLEVSDILDKVDQQLKDLSIRSVEDARSAPQNLVIFSVEMQGLNRELKSFLLQRLYRHHKVMRMQVKAQRMVRELFEAYRSEPRQLPEEVQERAKAEPLPRVICDYIAGMTDRFAIQEYRELFEPPKQD
jgi:dGTPase